MLLQRLSDNYTAYVYITCIVSGMVYSSASIHYYPKSCLHLQFYVNIIRSEFSCQSEVTHMYRQSWSVCGPVVPLLINERIVLAALQMKSSKASLVSLTVSSKQSSFVQTKAAIPGSTPIIIWNLFIWVIHLDIEQKLRVIRKEVLVIWRWA